MVISTEGAALAVVVRGAFDHAAASRLTGVAADYVESGGSLRDVVVDLRMTTECATVALECLGDLVSAGVRLRADGRRRPRARRAVCERDTVGAGSSA